MTEIVPTVVDAERPRARSSPPSAAAIAEGDRPKPRVLAHDHPGSSSPSLWMVPLLGLLVTSFRTKTDADATGWWTVFTEPVHTPDWTTSTPSRHGVGRP